MDASDGTPGRDRPTSICEYKSPERILIVRFNRFTILLSIPALAIAIVYPFFKRFFALPQAFLGIAFSFGIPMAFAAVYGTVPAGGWWLFGANFFWVFAYDTEYAMVDRDDDIRIGMKTSAITLGRADVAVVMACYAVYLAIWSAVLVDRIPHIATTPALQKQLLVDNPMRLYWS